MSDDRILHRIGAIGDIHAEDQLLEAALVFLRDLGLDVIMAVGDFVDGPGDVDRCCDLLKRFGVATVRGNHERWLMTGEARDLPDATNLNEIAEQSRGFIETLPITRSYNTSLGRLLLCHGLGGYDMGGVWPGDHGYALESNLALFKLVREAGYGFVVNGHTHNRMVRKFDHLTIINAGTLFHEHDPCFLVADFDRRYVQFYDLDHAKKISKGPRHPLDASRIVSNVNPNP
jgi:predicted phosphodiesterase